jgi:hypothetical protein
MTFLAFPAPLRGVFARFDPDIDADVDTDQAYQKECGFP